MTKRLYVDPDDVVGVNVIAVGGACYYRYAESTKTPESVTIANTYDSCNECCWEYDGLVNTSDISAWTFAGSPAIATMSYWSGSGWIADVMDTGPAGAAAGADYERDAVITFTNYSSTPKDITGTYSVDNYLTDVLVNGQSAGINSYVPQVPAFPNGGGIAPGADGSGSGHEYGYAHANPFRIPASMIVLGTNTITFKTFNQYVSGATLNPYGITVTFAPCT